MATSFTSKWVSYALVENAKGTVTYGVTNHEDIIFGGSKRDVIVDTLDSAKSKHADDIYFGGKGNDLLISLSGDDVLSGGAGNDNFFTGDATGDLIIRGGSGHDELTILVSDKSDLEPGDYIPSDRDRIEVDDRIFDVAGVEVIHFINKETLYDLG